MFKKKSSIYSLIIFGVAALSFAGIAEANCTAEATIRLKNFTHQTLRITSNQQCACVGVSGTPDNLFNNVHSQGTLNPGDSVWGKLYVDKNCSSGLRQKDDTYVNVYFYPDNGGSYIAQYQYLFKPKENLGAGQPYNCNVLWVSNPNNYEWVPPSCDNQYYSAIEVTLRNK